MNHIIEVANRLKGLRDALDMTVEEMAADLEITPETINKYESGTADIPVSFLHQLAGKYGVELTALMFGEEPRMLTYFVTRAGQGIKVERTRRYSYQDLAAGFQHRQMAPFLVTIEPKNEDGSSENLNTHKGHEFNYILDGEVEITVGSKVTILHPGDSIMFDASLPHALRTVGDTPVRIIAIIN